MYSTCQFFLQVSLHTHTKAQTHTGLGEEGHSHITSIIHLQEKHIIYIKNQQVRLISLFLWLRFSSIQIWKCSRFLLLLFMCVCVCVCVHVCVSACMHVCFMWVNVCGGVGGGERHAHALYAYIIYPCLNKSPSPPLTLILGVWWAQGMELLTCICQKHG